jgi:hypothetical protein
LTGRYRESLSFALPGHFVRTVQRMGWSGLVNGKLLVAAAREFDVLITGDRNRQYQQSASQLPMSVVVLIAPKNKRESFFYRWWVGCSVPWLLCKSLAILSWKQKNSLEKCYNFYSCLRNILLGYSLICI